MKGIFDLSLTEKIQDGRIGVIPTDTLYGLVGSALRSDVVERIYQARKRDTEKPMIILIGEVSQLGLFEIDLASNEQKILEKLWPNKISVVLPCPSEQFTYLHRGTQTLAFRLPAESQLRAFLVKTGPLVAPSANLQGEKPAETIAEAREAFGEKADFYVDRGELKSEPSTLISLENGKIRILREGAIKAI